ncbi:MAG: M42 family metallopeptidase [Anaerolineales bacterium]|nr:M42 family metallopeptidase [Anaerolineales bacterium]
MIEITRNLTEAYGPSGYEDAIRSIIRKEAEALTDDIVVDALGNLIATIHGDGTGRRIMLAAHMDEIGVIVTYIDKNGFLRIGPVGGVRAERCLGNRVKFSNGTLGVIWVEDREKAGVAPTFDQLYIDVGASSPDDCPVSVGDMACFDRTFTVQGDRWISKALDDRIGCVVLLEVMQKIKQMLALSHTIHFVFSAQEEVGVRGAQTAAFGLEPEIGIAIDVTSANDTPKSQASAIQLGKGAAIKVKDSGMIAHSGLVRLLVDRAKAENIPYQLEVLLRGSTDARAIQLTHSGAIAGCISIPTRYVHSVSEILDANDVHHVIKLLTACLKGPIDL